MPKSLTELEKWLENKEAETDEVMRQFGEAFAILPHVIMPESDTVFVAVACNVMVKVYKTQIKYCLEEGQKTREDTVRYCRSKVNYEIVQMARRQAHDTSTMTRRLYQSCYLAALAELSKFLGDGKEE